MKTILNGLFENKALSRVQAKDILMNISSGKYNTPQVAAFMSVYLMRPITVDELSGFRDAMLELSLPVKFNTEETIDIVGTGGDGRNTFNISTLACFVAAGAGIKVTKHGNYGVSTISGSSNVLEAIGYEFTNDVPALQRQLDEAGLCFLHAPLFHPAMKFVAPVRKDMGVRTFFNMLGPVVNPCRPKYQVLGVYDLRMARLYNYLLQNTSTVYSIVHTYGTNAGGYDEISLTEAYKVITNEKELVVEPEQRFIQQDLFGGNSIGEAATIFMKILNGKGTKAQNEVVIANAAIAIQTAKGIEPDESSRLARASLTDGRSLEVYLKLTGR